MLVNGVTKGAIACYFKLSLTICQKAEGRGDACESERDTVCLSSTGGKEWGQSPSAVLAGVASAAPPLPPPHAG